MNPAPDSKLPHLHSPPGLHGNLRHRIGAIFHDSVILDHHFRFISISPNILESIGYTYDELKGRGIANLSCTFDLQAVLEYKLHTGYFEEEHFDIRTKVGDVIQYGVSGCCLGSITNVTNIILLKFRNLDEISLMHDRMEAKTADIDRFVYLSAHALRGPLATIKGLLNLARQPKDEDEMKFLLEQIDIFADKLDDKLHRLIYFAESDKEFESEITPIQLHTICRTLLRNIEEDNAGAPVRFHCVNPGENFMVENGSSVLALLRNIVLFFCQQPKLPGNELVLDMHINSCAQELILRARGFDLSDALREKLRTVNSGYSEILIHPEMINCYAAKKIMFRLKGNIQFISLVTGEVAVHMTIPVN
jgi:hypothetical protein